MEYKYEYAGDYDPLPMSEPFEIVFICPECGSTVAASEREADAILGITKPEGTSGGPSGGKGAVKKARKKPAL
jgi:hypothetical protein